MGNKKVATEDQIIDKYIQRIMVDYPEADKMHIDLVQFAEEMRQADADNDLINSEIRVLQMVGPDGHAYWNAGEFSIIMPNGERYPMGNHRQNFGHGYRLEVRPDGIYYILQLCGSGYGKVDCTDGRFPPKKIISSNEYDTIKYVAEDLVMSDGLKADLAENGLS